MEGLGYELLWLGSLFQSPFQGRHLPMRSRPLLPPQGFQLVYISHPTGEENWRGGLSKLQGKLLPELAQAGPKAAETRPGSPVVLVMSYSWSLRKVRNKVQGHCGWHLPTG